MIPTYGCKRTVAVVFLFLMAACNPIVKNEKFNKTKWGSKDDWDFSQRDAILNDLISNHKLKGLNYKQLIDSLGEPANYGEQKDSIYYDIVVNYGYLDPKSGKYLVFHLDKDSIVDGFKIEEWHNRHVNE